MKAYCASFNVGNVEIWGTDLYLDKNSVYLEIKESKIEIFDRIECLSVFITKKEFNTVWKEAVSDIKKYGNYENKINQFDFFILEQSIQKNERCNIG